MEGKEGGAGATAQKQRLSKKKKVSEEVEATSTDAVSLEEKDYFTPPLMVSESV